MKLREGDFNFMKVVLVPKVLMCVKTSSLCDWGISIIAREQSHWYGRMLQYYYYLFKTERKKNAWAKTFCEACVKGKKKKKKEGKKKKRKICHLCSCWLAVVGGFLTLFYLSKSINATIKKYSVTCWGQDQCSLFFFLSFFLSPLFIHRSQLRASPLFQ